MGARVESTVTIERPVEDVFAYVLDLEANGPAWCADLESVEKTSEGPVGAGTTFRQVQNVMGKRRDTSLRFTAVDTNRKIEAAAELGPIAPRMNLVFETVDGKTRVATRGAVPALSSAAVSGRVRGDQRRDETGLRHPRGHRSVVSTRKGGGFYGYKLHMATCSKTGLTDTARRIAAPLWPAKPPA